jgi:hypothetical protein
VTADTGAPTILPHHPDTKPSHAAVVPGQGTLSRLDAVRRPLGRSGAEAGGTVYQLALSERPVRQDAL